jgi:hypothetical protein
MGRYAYFSTDFEYKFVFAVQSSSDIDAFGGARIGSYKRQWKKSQAPTIVEQLIGMSNDGKLVHDVEKYQKNVDGTYTMYWDMRDGKYDIDCLYMLGALIHHQLLYTDVLDVTFEI